MVGGHLDNDYLKANQRQTPHFLRVHDGTFTLPLQAQECPGGGSQDVYCSRLMSSQDSVPAPELELPILLAATVVKGFGRGSKMLGIPTANMAIEEIGTALDNIPTGIWYGWAFLRGEVYKAVASIGWNPYFHNDKKTVEPHLLHEFPDDFYGENLRFLLCGFVRTERNFPSLDALVTAIKQDIEVARESLEQPPWKAFAIERLDWTTTPSTTIAPCGTTNGSSNGGGIHGPPPASAEQSSST